MKEGMKEGTKMGVLLAVAVVAIILSAFTAAWALTRPTPVRAPQAVTFVVLAIEYKGTFGAGESQPPGTVVEAYRWDPSYIRVVKGDTVTLKIFGVNGPSHDPTTIDAFGQTFTVTRGQWTTVTFVADKAGLAEMVCHVPDHTETMHMVIDVVG